MTISSSPLSYQDCYDLMTEALGDDKGARVKMADIDAAIFLRMRMHNARKLDRNANKEIYDPGDKMYNVSIYDKLVVRIRNIKGEFWIYVEQTSMGMLGTVEKLSEVVEEEPEPVLAGPVEELEPIRRRDV